LDNNYQIQKNATLVKSKNFHQLNKAFETGLIGEMDGALSFFEGSHPHAQGYIVHEGFDNEARGFINPNKKTN